MTTPYFVILDNTLVNEPLVPGLPYWIFPVSRLPHTATAGQFVEDVLYHSELWANAAAKKGDDWMTLRLLECRKMCPRCGHLLVRMGDAEWDTIHIVWYIAHNPQPRLMTHEVALHLGAWHCEYLSHRCELNFFA